MGQVQSVQQIDTEASSLSGITGIYVMIGKIPPELAEAGVIDVEIEAEVEHVLKKAGIKVLQQREALSLPGQPVFFIQIGGAKAANLPVYAVGVLGGLTQRVTLERDSSHKCGAHTWLLSGATAGEAQMLNQKIKAAVVSLADAFVKDYLWANPKPHK
jgi:hypothetical protein